MTTPTPQRRRAYARLWLGGPYGEFLTTLGAAAREPGGVLVLTGDVGTGKTLLTQALIERLRAGDVLVGELPFPHLEPLEFLRSVAMAYGLASTFETREAFELDFESFLEYAAAERKKVLFVIDEAQELTPELFGEIERLLLRAAFSVLLVGQMKLDAILQDPSHAALAGQIRAHCRLRPLTDDEVAKYLAYRGPEPSPAGLRKVFREAKGVPRLIDHVARQLMVTPPKPLPAAVAPVLATGTTVRRSSRRGRGPRHGRLQLSRRVTAALVGGGIVVVLVLGITGYRVIQARTSPDTETRGAAVEQAVPPSAAPSPDAAGDTVTTVGVAEHVATPGPPSAPDTPRETATRSRIVERGTTAGRVFYPNTIEDARTPIDDETLDDLEPASATSVATPVIRTPQRQQGGTGEAARPSAAVSPRVTEPRPGATSPRTPQPGGADAARRTEERQSVSVSRPAAAASVPGRDERPASTPPSAVTPAPKQPQAPGPTAPLSATSPAPSREERPQPRSEAERAPVRANPPSKSPSVTTDPNPGAVIDWLLNKREKPR